jgi:hypothetical protein
VNPDSKPTVIIFNSFLADPTMPPKNIDVSYPNYPFYPDITTMKNKYIQHQSNKLLSTKSSMINLSSNAIK